MRATSLARRRNSASNWGWSLMSADEAALEHGARQHERVCVCCGSFCADSRHHAGRDRCAGYSINQQEAAGLGRILERIDGRAARKGDVSDGDVVDGADR